MNTVLIVCITVISVLLLILLATWIIYTQSQQQNDVPLLEGGKEFDNDYMYTITGFGKNIMLPQNVSEWECVRDIVGEFHNFYDVSKVNKVLSVEGVTSAIYGKKDGVRSSRLIIFIHGGDDSGAYRPPIIDDKLMNFGFFLAHSSLKVGDYTHAKQIVDKYFADVIKTKKYYNRVANGDVIEYKINNKMLREDSRSTNSSKKKIMKELYDELYYSNDFSNITYGMLGMYVKFINEVYDVCVLDYDGSIGSSLNQIRTQLKQIYDECEYSEIKMIGHSYGGYLTSLLLAYDSSMLSRINELYISAPLVTEYYESSDDVSLFHVNKYDSQELLPAEFKVDDYADFRKNMSTMFNVNQANSQMISVDREILSKLCAYCVYNFPFSLHLHSPFFEKSMCDDVRNIVERNVNNYTGKLFILCGNSDDNTKYNVEFYNLYNSLKQIRKSKFTTITIKNAKHNYIRLNGVDDCFINGFADSKDTRYVMDEPAFDISDKETGLNCKYMQKILWIEKHVLIK